MKILTKGWQKLLYGIGGMGVNMLNLMMGSYLCSAIIASGFADSVIGNQTFLQKDLVIAGVWAAFSLIAKILDGVIDIPMAAFTDRLRSKWGRRRPALIIGFVPMVAAYLAFLLITPENAAESMGNTVFYGIVLCVFYAFYTLTMVTYYATFTEIVDNEKDRGFISNVKSVCDIVYFILGYVVVSAMLKGMNIRTVGLIVLPLSLTMMIPLFLIKERSTRDEDTTKQEKAKMVGLFKSLAYTFRDKDYLVWMVVYFFMTFGVQLFLSGINEFFSVTGIDMTLTMAASFAPVPFTLILYNKLIRRRGFRYAFQWMLAIYAAGMFAMCGIGFMPAGTAKMLAAIGGGLICSFSIGALFAVAYSIPSELAAQDELRTGVSHSAMYFAVQGLFSGVATGIGGNVVLTVLKTTDTVRFMTLVCGAGCLVAFAFTYILPHSIVVLGKKEKAPKQEDATNE